MKDHLLRPLVLAALIFSAALYGPGQEERNVRAQMQFLAGDALQGRGSGTIFERIAAEYVGSQFMQFGLEPAGETGWDGKPSYIQTVTSTRNTFTEGPFARIGSLSLMHGKEMIVIRANRDAISGKLQKTSPGQAIAPGSAVLLSLPPGFTGNVNQAMQAIVTAGASIVMVEETPQIRSSWETMAARRPSYTVTFSPTRPSALIVLDKATAAAVAALAADTLIEFSGKLGAPEYRYTWNAIGRIPGIDPKAGVILLSSHLDHIGVRENEPGDDKIFNGADDDASGTVAVMELARSIAAGKRPKRTVYFVCYGSEEAGGLGSNYFVNNLPFPKDDLVANLSSK